MTLTLAGPTHVHNDTIMIIKLCRPLKMFLNNLKTVNGPMAFNPPS